MYSATQELQYLDMVVQESLRMYPASPRYNTCKLELFSIALIPNPSPVRFGHFHYHREGLTQILTCIVYGDLLLHHETKLLHSTKFVWQDS